MKIKLTEESIMFLSILKWFILAKIVGVLVGLSTTVFLSALTSGSEFTAGKEGPSAQIGAGVFSLFSSLLRLDDHDRKKLVICGSSAGFIARVVRKIRDRLSS